MSSWQQLEQQNFITSQTNKFMQKFFHPHVAN